MIPVEVSTTFLTSAGNDFVILLKGIGDERTLPISIGQMEAQSIAIHLNKVPFPRPLTHDLFKSLVDASNLKFLHTVIYNLKDDTFYAWLVFEKGDKIIEIDSRPSDAIAIALRHSAPLYVDDIVMDTAGIVIPPDKEIEFSQQDTAQATLSESEITALTQELTPLETLQRKLDQAVEEVRYEEAAGLRDKIDNFTQLN
ncbi:MAG: bifunctional nuclease family protein [Chitinispirillia bacterium]|nr:bifunctional nuclease family protein [Chitinispirillia bacterium]